METSIVRKTCRMREIVRVSLMSEFSASVFSIIVSSFDTDDVESMLDRRSNIEIEILL